LESAEFSINSTRSDRNFQLAPGIAGEEKALLAQTKQLFLATGVFFPKP
jgi:hypothetical protein